MAEEKPKDWEFFKLLFSKRIIKKDDTRRMFIKFQKDSIAFLLHLVEKDVVTKEELGKLWGGYLGVPYQNPGKIIIENDIVKKLPIQFARENKIIFLHQANEMVVAALSDPLDHLLLKKVEPMAGSPVKPVFAFPEEIEDAIKSAYKSAENLVNSSVKSEALEEMLDFIGELNIEELKYEISEELDELSEETDVLIEEAEKKEVRIPPKLKVRFSNDKLEAYIKVERPGKPIPITEDDIRKSLKDNGVVKGILEKSIEEVLVGKIIGQEVLIARGQPAENGKDGFIKPLEVLRKKNPEDCVDSTGRVDFKKMRMGNIVEEGEVVAEKVPPTHGENGHDVKGNILLAISGKKIDISLTPDVRISPENDLEIVALKNGILKKDFTIDEINFIKGDVDYSTGNISYPNSIVITGDVKSGFSVHCGENVEVRGCVEDAEVIADGDVIVKQGFLGTHKGMIKGKNVSIGHVKQQKVIASGDITIAGETIHSSLWAGGSIRLIGVRGIVIGGSLIAFKGIEVVNAGNTRNIKTTLKVGFNEETNQIEEQLKKLNENKEKLEAALRIIKVARELKSLSQEKKQLLEKLLETKKQLAGELNKLQTKRIEIIDNLMQEEKPYIKVTQGIFPNTAIQIGRLKKLITSEMRNKRFSVVRDNIFIGA